MNYITTTNLRTQSSKLVSSLLQGNKVSLMHRSQIIGEIIPFQKNTKLFDIKKFRSIIKPAASNIVITDTEREKRYRNHLKKRYGKDLS